MPQRSIIVLLLTATACAAVGGQRGASVDGWSPEELGWIAELSIDALGPLSADPSNRFADNPEAVRIGRELYHEQNLSSNRQVTCATCHRGEYQFTDDVPLSEGVGTTDRRSMQLRGVAHQEWFFWDGRKDSLWSQALAPLEAPNEHGISRTRVAQVVERQYRRMYEAAAGPMPEVDFHRLPRHARPAVDDPRANDAWWAMTPKEQIAVTEVYVNSGKFIAAFVRTFPPRPGNFDRYARALESGDTTRFNRLSTEAKAGLRLFLGKADCVACHSGPQFSDGKFHAVGVEDAGAVDRGRAEGLERLANEEFHYFSRWSDADPSRHTAPSPDSAVTVEAAFKTPSLRTIAKHPPYMHGGQYATLTELLQNSRTPGLHGKVDTHTDSQLTDVELAQIEAFLLAL